LKIQLVPGVVPGAFDVVAGKGLERVEGVPKADELEMCDVTLGSSKHEDTMIARSGLEVRNPSIHEVAEILIGPVE